MSTTATMPAWDLNVYFPGLESPEFESAFNSMKSLIAECHAQLDAKDLPGYLASATKMIESATLVYTYINCTVDTNTRDDVALAWQSKMESEAVSFHLANTRFAELVGGLDVEAAIAGSDIARTHSYLLRRTKIRSQHLMSPAEETLAAELNPSGASAWSRLRSAVTSQMEVPVALPSGEATLPMSAVRNLAHSPDRAIRKAAYEAELAAWKTVEVPCAACMNGIKGQIGMLAGKRGWGEELNASCFENAIDRETLTAMMAAARESFPDFRRYLKAKAKLIGAPALEWYDVFAPVGDSSEWPYEKGCEFVASQFDRYSSKLGDFARRSYNENWIDFPPRPGKVDGAYCAGPRGDESRILMNYDGTFGNVKTLAHELGHAYHNLCLFTKAPLLRDTPATLAETASIFCETIVKNAALETAVGNEKLALLEACIQAPAQTVVDISSRFLFESEVFEMRAERDMSATELCDAMLRAQQDTYGDGLCSYHPYMWAVKPHYYSSFSFYNYPYMFGLLFALGLYALYQKDPEAFRSQYDDLLASTGEADAATLGTRFGFETRSEEFWRGSLDVVRKDIDQFVSLVG